MTRISAVSPSEGTDVFLHYFMTVLGGVDTRTAQQMREELTTRFGGRHCSGQVCRMMTDLLNGHLATSRR